MFSCKNKNDKGEYRHTSKICNGIYLEVYRTFGSGAFGGDMICHYLTDTLNFRVCIGGFDNARGHFSYSCNADSLAVVKSEMADGDSAFHTIENKIYDIRKLKALHNISQSEIENISDKYLFENH